MNRFLSFFFCISLFSACESLQSTEIKIPTEDSDNKLVFHGFLVDKDSTITIHLDKSTGFFEVDTLESAIIGDLPGAEVRIYSDDILISELSYIPLELRLSGAINTVSNYTDTLSDKLDAFGKSFRLSLKHPDFKEISAEQDLPQFPPDLEINLVENLGSDINGDPTQGLVISFQDEGEIKDYYELFCYGILKDENDQRRRLIQISSDNPVFKVPDEEFPSSGSLFMADETFDGSKFTFSLYFTQSLESFDTLIVSWRSISREWYQYVDSEREQDRLNGFLGNFAEPFNVLSNIEGGYGVFGACREIQYSIQL